MADQAIMVHDFHPPTRDELIEHDGLMESMFSYLQRQLEFHCGIHHDPRHGLEEYQARVTICTSGPNMGKLVIYWECNYCRYIYVHARYLNRIFTKIQIDLAELQPPANPEVPIPPTMRMIDPFAHPFRSISRDTLLSTMTALSQLGQGIHPDQVPPQVDESIPTEGDQPQE